MSKPKKNPLNSTTKRFLYIVIGVTAFASIAIVTIATVGKQEQTEQQGSASIGSGLIPSGSGDAKPSPATLERLERVQNEEAKAAKTAGRTYIPENYLGSPEEVREALDRGELEERVRPSYEHYQQSSDNFTRNQRVSVQQQGAATHQAGLGSLEDGILRQMDAVVRNMQPATVSSIAISDFGVKEAREAALARAQEAPIEQNSLEEVGKPLISADEILAATLITPIDTYITNFTLAEVAGGPFNGAQLRGSVVPMTNSGDVEDVGIRFTSMTHNGVHYSIDAIALNEKTATDAMNGDVDRRYFSRVVMPILVAGLSGASTYFTARGTPSESVMRGEGSSGNIVVERERANREDAKNQGIGAATDKATSIIEQRVDRQAARPQRVTLPAYAPIGLIFNQPVYAN